MASECVVGRVVIALASDLLVSIAKTVPPSSFKQSRRVVGRQTNRILDNPVAGTFHGLVIVFPFMAFIDFLFPFQANLLPPAAGKELRLIVARLTIPDNNNP